ncbi:MULTISPECIES: hypothetical protein [Streptomyces]|uniref:hypothetical protein n=1 Tax=Streptomyces TaxID=1883 RepID=UPI00159F1A6D
MIDPRRDVDEYVAETEAHGFTVEAVINTHFHADFLAGHRRLGLREALGHRPLGGAHR